MEGTIGHIQVFTVLIRTTLKYQKNCPSVEKLRFEILAVVQFSASKASEQTHCSIISHEIWKLIQKKTIFEVISAKLKKNSKQFLQKNMNEKQCFLQVIFAQKPLPDIPYVLRLAIMIF